LEKSERAKHTNDRLERISGPGHRLLLVVLGYSFLLKSRLVNNCLPADTGPTTPVTAYSRSRPRLCENSKHEISSGNHSPYFLVSELDVVFLYPNKQMDSSFVKCRPKNNDHQIVFTHPRPTGDIRHQRWLPTFTVMTRGQ
jgi:hypothetical protein